jgi:hypothetical protein
MERSKFKPRTSQILLYLMKNAQFVVNSTTENISNAVNVAIISVTSFLNISVRAMDIMINVNIPNAKNIKSRNVEKDIRITSAPKAGEKIIRDPNDKH